MQTRFHSENMEGKPLGRPRRRWEDNIKANLKKYVVRVWTGFSWVMIKPSDRFL